MKKKYYLLALLFTIPVFLQAQDEWAYFGLTRPGNQPEVFARAIISGLGRIHCFPTFTSDNREVYWMTFPRRIQSCRYENGKWTSPDIPDFAQDIICMRPFVAPGSDRIYFGSRMDDGYGSADICYIERTADGYSEPVILPPPVNTEGIEVQPTLTTTGTLYYNGVVPGKRFGRGILCARFENGVYMEPEVLGPQINVPDSAALDYTPFIAPDESFLLFCSNRQNISEEACRIYVSFRAPDGEWQEPLSVSEALGFDDDSRDPALSPDGKFLFFSSGDNIYWVSTEVLDRLRKAQ